MSATATEIAKHVTTSTSDLRHRLQREIDGALRDFRDQTGLNVERLEVQLQQQQVMGGPREFNVYDIALTISG